MCFSFCAVHSKCGKMHKPECALLVRFSCLDHVYACMVCACVHHLHFIHPQLLYSVVFDLSEFRQQGFYKSNKDKAEAAMKIWNNDGLW